MLEYYGLVFFNFEQEAAPLYFAPGSTHCVAGSGYAVVVGVRLQIPQKVGLYV